jgi:hypothetical protein
MSEILTYLNQNLFVDGKATIAFFGFIVGLALFLGSSAVAIGWRMQERQAQANNHTR